MRYKTHKWVRPEDLNANGTLFGGKLLSWIDDEAALYSIVILKNNKIVTKFMSEINFMSSARQGDIIEIGLDIVKFGKTSITMKCEVKNIMTKATIITVDSITMVNLDSFGQPANHGKKQSDLALDEKNV
ncbi:acyl-CoA thioesterase [Flavobacterium oreochromis]|uniref:Hotdog domain-containing protein n=1 Tax=Flavobacterium oreochromis TaxID=2906078 RepID=A0ABW8PCV1_9FLAO|nr:hotdog domain-containing protein [Flavobacterium oreochromis]OWP73953.1 acyl-CoA thioesterase [Flavobacterium oreochromis]POR20722.1 acyl-CoA thioesterase [Flavobacterium columnare]QYS86185.1 acyl-CoA thioesterase [Flavobacterium oreochromis]